MKSTPQNSASEVGNENRNMPGRREFLGKLGKGAIVAAAAGAIGAKPFLGGTVSSVLAQSTTAQRAFDAYQYRLNTALFNFQNTPSNLAHPNNGDEALYPNKINSFSKGLPHKPNGEVVNSAYNSFRQAVNSGLPSSFELIPQGGDRRLVNPQAGLAFDLEGSDSHALVQPPAPTFASRETAAEIAENYWMALLRDVPFSQYNNNPIANAAAADLTLYGADFKGAKNNAGVVTPRLLFRGLTPGDRIGPYLSQFFYQPCFFGANEISQQIVTTVPGVDYMTDFNTWRSVQNGVSQNPDILDPTRRYMRNGRDIGQWVHIDVLFQGYFQAFLILANNIANTIDAGNPYNLSNNQEGFGTFGRPAIGSLVAEVSSRALKAVWYQKWFVHRRARPEVFAERVHRTLNNGAGYPVHPEILNSINSGSRLGGFLTPGNAFLPMAFPEGSPLHPAYGAGHATVAGACVTILKAFFDETIVFANPVQPSADGLSVVPFTGNPLTVGGELNKIASNVALGRNIAGVHWRSDGTESLLLGEQLAISILRDQRASYNEQFTGYSLTKFDGTTIII